MSDTRPRIALVTDAIFPYHHGGKEIRTYELSRRLGRHADVHVYTMKWWPGPRTRTDEGVTYHAVMPRLPLYRRGRRSIVQALAFGIACSGLAFARFDALEADHMPYWQLFPLWLITRIRRKRFVVTWHECWGREYWRTYLGRSGVVGWWLERLAMRLPDAIIAASPSTAARLVEMLGPDTPVTVAPNGIDLAFVRSVPAALEPHDVVCVGRLMAHKRVDVLIEAVARLRDAGRRVSLRVIGNGPERERLEAQAKALGVEQQVRLGPPISTQAELFAELKASRAFVFPSDREGFGIAALEALAAGLPVITTSAPHNMAQHLVRRSLRGVVCEPGVDHLAEAISVMLSNGAGHRPDTDVWLDEFDWDSIAERFAAVVLG